MPAINHPFANRALAPHQQIEVETSAQAVREIDELNSTPAFIEFMAKFEKRATELAKFILNDAMPTEERERLRNIRLGIVEVLERPAQDRKAHCRILEGYGRGPGHPDGE